MMHQPSTALNASQTGFRSIPGPVSRDYFYFVPAGLHEHSPIIVSVHGVSLNAAEHMLRLRAVAEANHAVVIAPHFGRRDYRGYQQLQSGRTGVRSDLALIDILADARQRFGLAPGKIHLTGFSGGAQFAHRFALYHAEFVATCVSCAAGWYTFPDAQYAHPLGIAPGTGPGGMSVHPRWADVHHHVVVGSRDTAVDDVLNMTEPVVTRQGIGRRERARRWVKAMARAQVSSRTPRTGATVLRGLSHDFTKAHERHNLANHIANAMGLLAPRSDEHV